MTNAPHTIRAARLAAGLLLPLLSGCMIAQPLGLPQIQGSGVAKTETRTVADFTDLEVSSAVHVELAVGAATTVVVTADDNILPHVVTEVASGKLKIHIDAPTASKL